jgi:HlyD family secretion protein
VTHRIATAGRRFGRWPWFLAAAAVSTGAGFAVYQPVVHAVADNRSAAPQLAEVVAPISVTVTAAARREIIKSVSFAGSLVAREEVLVSPQIDGVRIEAYFADIGDSVEEGQILARLDRSMLEARLLQNASEIAGSDAAIAQAGAALAEAEAAGVEANAALERARRLIATGNVTGETLQARDTAARVSAARILAQRQNLRSAEAGKALVEAQRREIELGLSRTEVRAPASGVIAHRAALVGQSVAASSEPLFRIMRGGEVELRAEVPEDSLQELAAGQRVSVELGGHQQPIIGHVRLVAPTVDMASGLGAVWVTLPADAALRPGRFAQGTIETTRRDSVVVPRTAVHFGADGPRVQVVEDDAVANRIIIAGWNTADGIEVLDGLREGEVVVARAGGFLRDGDAITPVHEGRSNSISGRLK